MQIHGVPDSERASRSTGQRLPWGFETYGESPDRRDRFPVEKGPFGKARKRGTSRSKTATPARPQDQAKLDNLRVIDDIFNRHKEEQKIKESQRAHTIGPSSSLPISASAPNLGESVGGLAASFQPSASTVAAVKEPTEVVLYGYGNDAQWAALDFYEKASRGIILEDYPRHPPGGRINHDLSDLAKQHEVRNASIRSLPRAALRSLNAWLGGEHWIKVTFDSAEAAERACHYSPHVLQGYVVHAERFRAGGPQPQDIANPAHAGSALSSHTASPHTVTSTTLPLGTSSATLSSATATGTIPSMPPRMNSEPVLPSAFPEDEPEALLAPQPTSPLRHRKSTGAATTTARPPPSHGNLIVRGAKPITLLPADKAFLPAKSKWAVIGTLPVIGWFVGSGNGIIGDQVPRREDGSFDSEKASLYWKAWWCVDQCFGTDFCGVRDADMDE